MLLSSSDLKATRIIPTLRLAAVVSLIVSLLSCGYSSAAMSFLEQASKLQAPIAEKTEHGDTEGIEFWQEHSATLQAAWKEWEEMHKAELLFDNSIPSLKSLLDDTFQSALQAAWEDPDRNEEALSEMFQVLAPGVYGVQLFNPDKIHHIRTVLDAASSSNETGIPTRRPNAMNRYGVILEPSIPGAVHVSVLNQLYQDLVEQVMRPVTRMLFPEYFSRLDKNDEESYAFSIKYRQDLDLALAEHSDASLMTINININLPNEKAVYGSSPDSPCIYFVDDDPDNNHDNDHRKYYNMSFQPGMAVLHRGLTRHAAYPLQSGERTNLVLWTFGKHGYVRIVPHDEHERQTPRERWRRGSSRGRRNNDGNHHHNINPFIFSYPIHHSDDEL